MRNILIMPGKFLKEGRKRYIVNDRTRKNRDTAKQINDINCKAEDSEDIPKATSVGMLSAGTKFCHF